MKNSKKNGAVSPSCPDEELQAENGVGYKNPPKDKRFKPGRSANPKGRPAGSRNLKSIVSEIANELHWVEENGKRRQRSTLELVLLSIRNRSLEGDVRAFRDVHDLLEKYGPQEPLGSGGYGFIIVPETLSPEDWLEKAKEYYSKTLPPEDN